jgi:hypothetical protein
MSKASLASLIGNQAHPFSIRIRDCGGRREETLDSEQRKIGVENARHLRLWRFPSRNRRMDNQFERHLALVSMSTRRKPPLKLYAR